MINIGDFNLLKVARKAEFGYYLDAGTGRTGDDILLPNSGTLDKELVVGEEVNAFIYRDSKDRLIATLKEPLAKVGDIAYLKVVGEANFGTFIDFGLDRDILVPLKEQEYRLVEGNSYLFYIYLDKTGRIAGSTKVDKYLINLDTGDTEEIINNNYRIGDKVIGTVYGFQTNGSAMVAIDKLYRGVILKNEYFMEIGIGEELKLRIKKIYEDGKMGLTPRKKAVEERTQLEQEILDYLKNHDNFMPFNDKSSPEDIKNTFHESKNYFKNALGGLMKKGLIEQIEKGTILK